MGRTRTDRARFDDFQFKHLQHLFELRQMGMLVLNGPTVGDFQLRGIGIFVAGSATEVQSEMVSDPLVAAGYLNFEVYPWFGLPGDRLP